MNYNRVERAAAEVYEACDIRTFPIDCSTLLAHYDLRAIDMDSLKEKSAELYDLCLAFSEDSFLFREKKLIIYRNTNPSRTRFSLMHELGHYLLDHCYNTPEDEPEANHFASYLLVPRPVIRYMGRPDIRRISRRFNISWEAARIVCDDYYRWWYYMPRTLPDWEQRLVDRLVGESSTPARDWLIMENENWCQQQLVRRRLNTYHTACSGFIDCPKDFTWDSL